ncbi:hypothetical protein [Alsobacter sp. R-9]
MSLPHASPSRDAATPLAGQRRAPWPPGLVATLAAWAAATAMAVASARDVGTVFGDTDDAMRLVQVRDLLAGQGWTDLVQHRLDPGAGIPMHWSRLADLPLALAIRGLEPFMGTRAAEVAAMTWWPAVLLLVAMLALRAIAERLAGPAAAGWAGIAAAVLAASSLAIVWQFAPGRIDHHGLQATLLLWAFANLLAGPAARHGVAAGLCSAAALAVGLETLPFLAMVAGGAALVLGLDPATRRAAAGYGLSFAAGTAALYAGTIPAARWGVAACDALSLPWLAAAVVGGAGLAAVALLPAARTSTAARVGGLVMVGAAAAAAVIAIDPACLRGPYAKLDPALYAAWLDNVQETLPLHRVWAANRSAALVLGAGPLLALAALPWLARRTRAAPMARTVLIAWAVAFLIALALGLVQQRMMFYANVLALPVLAATIGLVAERRREAGGSPAVALAAGLVVASSATPTLAVAMVPGLAGAGDTAAVTAQTGYRQSCFSTASYAPLRGLPPGIVAAFVHSGPFILAGTPHAVLSAPYHRMEHGILAGYRFLALPPDEARAAAKRLGIRYVAACTAAEEVEHYAATAPDGLAARLIRREVPGWLAPVPGAPPGLLLYRVLDP